MAELTTTETTAADSLFGGAFDVETREVTLDTGNCVRGSVLGKITTGAATASAVSGGGNGTLTLDATTPKLVGNKAGAYTVKCISAATDSGRFEVTDPDGISLGTVLVGATFANQIKFVIADGSSDFVVGSLFTVTIAAGSGKYVLCDSTAVDGSGSPGCVLAEDADATGGDKTVLVYLSGTFNEDKLVFGGADTISTHRDALRAKNIYARATSGQ